MLLASFRNRLLLAIFGCAATAIVAGGFFTYEMVERNLEHEFDHFLHDKLRFHRVSCVQHGNRLSFKLPPAAWKRIHDPTDPEYFQFRFQDGRDAFRCYSIPDDSPGLPILGMNSDSGEARDCILPNGNPGRALGISFYPTEVDPGDAPIRINLVVAHQRGELLEALLRLRELIFIAGAIAAALLLAATMLIVRQLLRPLANLAQQIAEAPVGSETREFALAGAPLELQPIVARLNALMARVSSAFDNERQFTSNAAHELRNPLAGLRSQVEVALERTRDPNLDEDTLINVLEVQRQMEGVVENLLILARLDSGTEQIESSQIDLNTTARRAWKPFFDRASDQNIKVHWALSPSIPNIETSPRLVEILLTNLFDNATSYTPQGGEINVSTDRLPAGISLTVANSNPGIDAADADRLFQRFHRGKQTSTGSRQHAGIGLSLCQKIADTLGCEISTEVNSSVFAVSVSFPISLKKNLPKS